MSLILQLIVVYLTTCFEDATSCSANMCLSWELSKNRLSIICTIKNPDFIVHIADPRNKTAGDCSPPGCDTYINNSEMSRSGNRYFLEVNNIQEEQVDGTWTCVNGRNGGVVTTVVSSKVSINESPELSTTLTHTAITEDKSNAISKVTTAYGIYKSETSDIVRYDEKTTSPIDENTKTWIENIADIVRNKTYIPIWIGIVLFLIFFVSCNIFISRKCRSSHSLKLENSSSGPTNTQIFRTVKDSDDIISDYASIDENQILSQANLQEQLSQNRRQGDRASYCSIIPPSTSSSLSSSRSLLISAHSNGYLDVIADVYESPITSRYLNCDEEHRYSTTASNNVAHVYQNDAFVQ